MINTQSESVVVFKGSKVEVVEETEGPPSTVAVVEPSTGESNEISEAKRERRWKMVEDGGEDLTQEQKQQFFLLLLANTDVFAPRTYQSGKTLCGHWKQSTYSAACLVNPST